jgi:hypothetical protein
MIRRAIGRHNGAVVACSRGVLLTGLLGIAGAVGGAHTEPVTHISFEDSRRLHFQLAGAIATTVVIQPGDDIQASVDANAPGTTFLLKAGVHRLQSIRPRDGDTFTGEAGTVLSGARPLNSFVRVGADPGGYWVATGQTQEGAHDHHGGGCQDGYPRCYYPEQLFIDDQALVPVASLADVGPGTWFFDYDADAIYFADDPTGRRIETSVTPTAFEATADNVTVSGLTIERFASIDQTGAIQAAGRTGWVVAGNEVRWNHGEGIRVGSGAQVRQNNVHHNGQLGIAGLGDAILVADNEIAYNNAAKYFQRWESGGAKFIGTTNLIVRGNFAHHNDGPGLWSDMECLNTLYENNVTQDNQLMGILHEISYAAVIRNNIVKRNGFGLPDWIAGSGILIAASSDVEVYGNLVDGNADGIGGMQQNRGSGTYGPYEVRNLWVHDNAIANTPGWAAGLAQDIDSDTSYFTSRNNHFDRNSYQLGNNPYPFVWMNGDFRTEVDWVGFGEDVNGSFAR